MLLSMLNDLFCSCSSSSILIFFLFFGLLVDCTSLWKLIFLLPWNCFLLKQWILSWRNFGWHVDLHHWWRNCKKRFLDPRNRQWSCSYVPITSNEDMPNLNFFSFLTCLTRTYVTSLWDILTCLTLWVVHIIHTSSSNG